MISSAPAEEAPGGSPASVLRDALLAVRELGRSAVEGALGPLGPLGPLEAAALIDMLADLRRLRAATAALEVQVQVRFDRAQRQEAIDRGAAMRDAGKGIAEQVALARGVSSYRAANDLALARGLVGELPATLRALTDGFASEQAAINVARETVCLMPEDRAVVDEVVAGRLAGMSPRRAAAFTRAEAARVDGQSVVRRIRQAEQDRCVTVRPAPDAMVYLSALLPVKEGVAAYAALARHADTLRATGSDDRRSRGAIMADALVARLTGREHADRIPVEVQLVMPATSLIGGSDLVTRRGGGNPLTAGEVCGWIGEQPIPAALAREIALIGDDGARRWVRRLFTDPQSGDVTAVDTKRRRFSGAMRRAIVARDRACRGCSAPIRQIDHVTAYADGGATTMLNGQGLCERCNQAKALPGWRASAFIIEGRHTTVTRTPTGHRYVSQPPPPIIEPPPGEPVRLDEWLAGRLPDEAARSDLRALPGGIDIVTPIRRHGPGRHGPGRHRPTGHRPDGAPRAIDDGSRPTPG